MMSPSEFLNSLGGFPKRYGRVRDKHFGQDPKRIVIIFQDNPENWSVRRSIGEALLHFKWIKIFGQDGDTGQLDTSLLYAIPDHEMRKEAALYFLTKLMVSPAEYANALRGEKTAFIKLIGVEDEELYEESIRLHQFQPAFLKQQLVRSTAIVENLLGEMERSGEAYAALSCCGDLPDLVSEELEKREITYAIIQPRMTRPSDQNLYKKALQSMRNGKMEEFSPSYQEVYEDGFKGLELPPEQDYFPDKKMDEMKEKARRRLIQWIETESLLPKLESALPQSMYGNVKRIIGRSDLGPKTKAVLVKAELFSSLMTTELRTAMLKYKINDSLHLVGVIAYAATFAGALFGLGTQPWFQTTIALILGLLSLIKLLTRRFVSAFGWILVIAGFFGGQVVLERWGALLGTIIAGLVWLIVLPKQKIPEKEYKTLRSAKELENLLTGASEV